MERLGDNTRIEYYDLPAVSQEFIDEVFIRTKLCLDALEILSSVQKNTFKNKSELSKKELLSYMICNFVITELYALFDGSSKLSINLEKNREMTRINIQKMKLRKIFPSFSTIKLNILHKNIESLVVEYKDIILKLIWTRHNKSAHANISYFEHSDKELRYRKDFVKRLPKFIEAFQLIFIKIGFED